MAGQQQFMFPPAQNGRVFSRSPAICHMERGLCEARFSDVIRAPGYIQTTAAEMAATISGGIPPSGVFADRSDRPCSFGWEDTNLFSSLQSCTSFSLTVRIRAKTIRKTTARHPANTYSIPPIPQSCPFIIPVPGFDFNKIPCFLFFPCITGTDSL